MLIMTYEGFYNFIRYKIEKCKDWNLELINVNACGAIWLFIVDGVKYKILQKTY